MLDFDLQRQLIPIMSKMKPLRSIYFPDFIAANQEDRADNVLPSTMSHKELIEQIRSDIRNFKKENELEKVIVLWTATTERFADVRAGLNQTADELLASIDRNEKDLPQLAAYAAGRILKEEAVLAWDERLSACIIWQELEDKADSAQLTHFFEEFTHSCDWWVVRAGELNAPPVVFPDIVIRP